jgi:methyl coenzyme M reductase subunit D
VTTKTSKEVMPIVLHKESKEHPAQVQPISKDVTVGTFTTIRRTGTVTALQKFEALKQLDELLVEVVSARQRANQTEAPDGELGGKLAALLLEPFDKFN